MNLAHAQHVRRGGWNLGGCIGMVFRCGGLMVLYLHMRLEEKYWNH